MNLRALFLSSFSEGLKLWINQLKAKQNKPIAGLMWFLFLWINEYFPELYRDCGLAAALVRDTSTYSLQHTTISISTFSNFQIPNRLFKMQPRVYLEVYPFLDCSHRPTWVQLDLLIALDEELVEVVPYWSSAF